MWRSLRWKYLGLHNPFAKLLRKNEKIWPNIKAAAEEVAGKYFFRHGESDRGVQATWRDVGIGGEFGEIK